MNRLGGGDKIKNETKKRQDDDDILDGVCNIFVHQH